ncbi:hypothetical protein EJB05_36227 [Eragrostis curvula]|uniref:Uncharacterized protein n=1 Tax=Eragrostis curvula TaxID=38414 RepID=A0A5J9UA39_9POAL|nr:hypothetical protein EJB05_36227 [Eragrostis curvula]
MTCLTCTFGSARLALCCSRGYKMQLTAVHVGTYVIVSPLAWRAGDSVRDYPPDHGRPVLQRSHALCSRDACLLPIEQRRRLPSG